MVVGDVTIPYRWLKPCRTPLSLAATAKTQYYLITASVAALSFVIVKFTLDVDTRLWLKLILLSLLIIFSNPCFSIVVAGWMAENRNSISGFVMTPQPRLENLILATSIIPFRVNLLQTTASLQATKLH